MDFFLITGQLKQKLGKHKRKCQLYFFPFFSIQVSLEAQISWAKTQEINDLSSRLPEVPFPAVSCSSRQHQSPRALQRRRHPRAPRSHWKSCWEHGFCVTPTFANFRYFNFLASTHNMSRKVHYFSQQCLTPQDIFESALP